MRLTREEFAAICKEYLPVWKKAFPAYSYFKALSDDTLKMLYDVYREDSSWDDYDHSPQEVAQCMVDNWSEIPVSVMNEFFELSAKEDKISISDARSFYNGEGATFKKGSIYIVNCEVIDELDAKDIFHDATGHSLPFTGSAVDF